MDNELYFEDYEIGTERVSGGRTITETDIVIHAGQTGDYYPQHTDVEFCKGTSFGQRIAHGTLTFSIGMGLQCNIVNPLAFTYGYDRLRFTQPVFIGDTIHTKVIIHERREDPKRPGRGFIVERITIINQHEQLVMICDHIISVEKKS
jgi:acyl dehydratase